MLGDTADFAARLKRLIPRRWTADTAPALDAVLSGFGSAWATLYGILSYAKLQTRIATATDTWLDMISFDFLGRSFWRRKAEPDQSFSARLRKEIFRPRGTRGALALKLTDLTGRAPVIFEPANASDTGGWGSLGMTQGMGMAYGGKFAAGVGGYGSIALPSQAFVTAFRARGGGIPDVMGVYLGQGWAGGGIGSLTSGASGSLMVASLSMSQGQITDTDIQAAIVSVAPAASIIWTRITN
jgi:hypothetical protein